MTEYGGKGPYAAWQSIDAAISSAQLSGIVGDSAHTYGYHRGRNYVSPGDYSAEQSDDLKGPGEAATGLDVTLSDADMKTVSKRLNTAVNNGDDRLHCLREWYGTTDGYTVTGRDVRTGNYITSDDSHLWHVHLSFYRRWADDETECRKVAAVVTGGSSSGGGAAPSGGDEMDYNGGYNGNDQALTNGWRTLAIGEDGSQTWKWGPVKFQAQANIVLSGLPTGGQSARFRWAAYDVRKSDGYTKPDPVNAWGDIEVLGTSGSTYTSIVQYGSIGTPPSGYSRRLRLQGYSDAASGVKVTGLRWALFSQ